MDCIYSLAVNSSGMIGFMKQFSMENMVTIEQLDKLEKDCATDVKVEQLRKVSDVMPMDIVNLKKDQIKNMQSNLTNLKLVLEFEFTKIKYHQFDNAVLVIGDTGCGKSTLLSTLIHGSSSLQMRTKTENIIKIANGGEYIEKVSHRKVIDNRDNVKEHALKNNKD